MALLPERLLELAFDVSLGTGIRQIQSGPLCHVQSRFRAQGHRNSVSLTVDVSLGTGIRQIQSEPLCYVQSRVRAQGHRDSVSLTAGRALVIDLVRSDDRGGEIITRSSSLSASSAVKSTTP